MTTEYHVLQPARTADTYKRLVSLAIELREYDRTLEKAFRLCIPVKYLPLVAVHFSTRYAYNVLGGCFTDKDDCIVRWYPIT